MIQSGIHFAPILRQNQFELQSRDDSVDFGPAVAPFHPQPGDAESKSTGSLSFLKGVRQGQFHRRGWMFVWREKLCRRQTALPPCGRSSLVFASSVPNDFVSCLLSCLKKCLPKASYSDLQCLLFTLPRSWIRRWRPR